MLASLKAMFSRSNSARPQIARLYEYEGWYFTCSVRWIAETGVPTVLDCGVDNEQLGNAILGHLAAFDPSELDIRDDKKSDWPAFKASGAKSCKAFESQLWHCDLELREDCFTVLVRPRISLKDGLSAHCSARCHDPAGIGNAVRDAISGAKAMRSEGVI